MVWLGLLDGQAKRDDTIKGHASTPPDRRPQGPDFGEAPSRYSGAAP